MAGVVYVQSDPIGLRGGLNTYTYVKGNPLSLTDPDGLQASGISRGIPGVGGGISGPSNRPNGRFDPKLDIFVPGVPGLFEQLVQKVKDFCSSKSPQQCYLQFEAELPSKPGLKQCVYACEGKTLPYILEIDVFSKCERTLFLP